MSRSLFACIFAACSTAPILGESVVTYTLELSQGSSANHRSSWKSMPCDQQPLFDTSDATTADGQYFYDVITWDVRVSVSGTHSSGFVPSGVARAAFDLELRDFLNNPVAVGKATNDAGQVVAPGFFSSINDGTARVCPPSPDPNQAAAFPVAFSVSGFPFNGRVIDDYFADGPGMTDYQYPSTGPNGCYPTGFPPGSTAQPGTLVGMRAGYPVFQASGCPFECGSGPGFQTAGVGYTSLSGDNCNLALGRGPIAEGQINTVGLVPGTYTLTLVPGSTQILKGDFDCQNGQSADFAAPADVVIGSSRGFVLIIVEDFCFRTVAARRLFYDNSCYDGSGNGCTAMQCQGLNGGVIPCSDDTAIACDKTPQLPGSGPATFANYSSYSRGLNGLVIDVAQSVGCPSLLADASMFTFTVGNVANPTTPAPPPSLIVTTQLNASTDRVKIYWPNFGQPGCLPNHQWLKVVVKGTFGVDPAHAIPDLAADDVFYWGLAIGESNTPNTATPKRAVVDGVDELNARSHPTGLTRIAMCNPLSPYDYDKSSRVDGTDQLISRNAPNTLTAISLFSR